MDADSIIADIIRREGVVYTDDSTDRGGPTKFGITLPTLQQYNKQATLADLQALDIGTAHDVYAGIYIKPFSGFIEPFLGMLVDSAVQHGVSRVRGWLAALGSSPSYSAFLSHRIEYYGQIVVADPTQLKFLNGWLNRVCQFIR